MKAYIKTSEANIHRVASVQIAIAATGLGATVARRSSLGRRVHHLLPDSSLAGGEAALVPKIYQFAKVLSRDRDLADLIRAILNGVTARHHYLTCS